MIETLTAEDIRGLLYYDPGTGLFTWSPNAYRFRGCPAGTSNGKGYWRISIGKRFYFAHRLAWLYVYGEWPVGEVDHVNRNGFDNRISNLRLATRSQNAANKTRCANNTSGFKGVQRRHDGKAWTAIVRLPNGKNKYLGSFKDIREAHAVYMRTAVSLYGEFAAPN